MTGTDTLASAQTVSRGPRADLRVAATVLVWVPAVLLVDARAGLGIQWLLGGGTWLLLLALLRQEAPTVRAQVAVVVVFATTVEYTFAGLLEVYVYRLDNVPAYVPPGHGLVYLCALALGRSDAFRAWARPLVVATVALGGAYAAYGVVLADRVDVLGAFWFGCLLFFLRYGRSPLLYVGAFVVVTYLELLGTALGVWTWQPRDPTGLVAIGNPPSGAAGGYGWFDLAAVLAAPAILRCYGQLRGRLDVGVRGRKPAKTASCSRPLVDTALPPVGPGSPSRSVKVPPASSTMTHSAARSHSDTSGSAAASIAPSATSTWDQKSPYALVRQQERVRSRKPSRRSCFSQPSRLE
ncbi:hypothetical protein BH24ACT13_BH24ACT13_06810 [soil metagenome]|jgi:hypothetical protein